MRPSTTEPCRRPASRGAVLVLTLVILMAVAAMVVESVRGTYESSLEARRLAAEYQADLLAESLLDAAKALLIAGDEEANADIPKEEWAEPVEARDGSYKMRITPCNSRLDLNRLADNTRLDEAVRTLLEDNGKSADAASALLDWTDADTEPSQSGAERNAYLQNNLDYKPKNGALDTVEEALLVLGWQDVDLNFLRNHFTAWSSKEPNINFCNKNVFEAYLPEIADSWAEVRSYRKRHGFTSKDDLKTAIPDLEDDPALWKEISDAVSLQSWYFEVVIEVRLPLVYELRRYILLRKLILANLAPSVIRCDVLKITPSANE